MEKKISTLEAIGKEQRSEKLIRNEFAKGKLGETEYNEDHPSAKMSENNPMGKGAEAVGDSFIIPTPGGSNKSIKPLFNTTEGGGSYDRERRKWGSVTNLYSPNRQYGADSIEIDEIEEFLTR